MQEYSSYRIFGSGPPLGFKFGFLDSADVADKFASFRAKTRGFLDVDALRYLRIGRWPGQSMRHKNVRGPRQTARLRLFKFFRILLKTIFWK